MERKCLGILALAGALSMAAPSIRAEEADTSKADISTSDVSTADVSPTEVSRSEIAPAVSSSTPALPGSTTLAPAPAVLDPKLGGDDRRTMGRFVPNLGSSLIGVFSQENLKPLLVGTVLTSTGSFLDQPTKGFMTEQRRFAALGNVGHTAGGARIMAPLTAALFVAGRAAHDTRFRAATYDAAHATIATGAYTFLLKKAVHRTRPNGSNTLSFPSGHTSNAIAWATIAHHYYGAKAGVPLYAAAGLIGLSRIERNVHHVSDVLAGGTLGYIVGRTVLRQHGESVGSRRQLAVTPATDAHGSGLGLQLSVQF